ncbi:hypothetical protein pb186bvf_005500 [Paramecium bursaria]
MNQRWLLLKCVFEDKENLPNITKRPQILNKKIKKCPPLQLEEKKQVQHRTISTYFKNIKKQDSVCFIDERGIKHEFPCFEDTFLKLPQHRNILLNVDNDCASDEETIEYAKEQIQKHLKYAIQQQ